jgi:hypothetical protein
MWTEEGGEMHSLWKFTMTRATVIEESCLMV